MMTTPVFDPSVDMIIVIPRRKRPSAVVAEKLSKVGDDGSRG
jgi:hypothetical protein